MAKKNVNDCEYINIKDVGERIKNGINNSEYKTQKEYEIKTNTPNIQNQVKGNSIMNIDKLAGFCKNLGVSADYLLFGNDDKVTTTNVFYPKKNDITVQGIYYAINYLLAAFGDDIIFDLSVPYFEYDDAGNIRASRELTVPCLAIYNCDIFNDDVSLNGISKYLNFIKDNKNLKKTMLDSGFEKEYKSILKDKANINALVYDSFFDVIKNVGSNFVPIDLVESDNYV